MSQTKTQKSTQTKSDKFAEYVNDCERQFVACCLVDPLLIAKFCKSLTADMFRLYPDNPYGTLWKLLVDMFEADLPLNVSTVIAETKKQEFLTQLGGIAGVAKMVKDDAVVANAAYLASEIKRIYKYGLVMAAARDLCIHEHETDCDPKKLLARFDAKVAGVLADVEEGQMTIREAMLSKLRKRREAKRQGKAVGFLTGFLDIDKLTGGFFPKQLWLLGGRSFAGKTALALSIATRQLEADRSVFFISLEMTTEELAERVLSDQMTIDFKRWSQEDGFSDGELETVENSLGYFDRWKLDVSEEPDETTKTIAAKARLIKATKGLDLLIVDNLQLLRPIDLRMQKHEYLAAMTRDFKILAKKLDCAVLVLSQLNGDAEGAEPNDRHWAGSKSIKNDADVAVLMHRPEPTSKIVELNFTKVRKNNAAKLNIYFDGPFQRFENVMQDEF